MGCDYYIYTYLEIKHTDGVCYYQLKRKRGYYSEFDVYPEDSDEDFSVEENERLVKLEKIRENYKDIILEPTKPKIIYNNGKWTCKEYESKYITYIDTYIDGSESPYKKDDGYYFKNSGEALTDFSNILEIQKVEYRIDFMNM